MTRGAMGGIAVGVLLLLGCSVGASGGDEPVPVPATSADAGATLEAVDLLRSGTKFIDETSFRVDTDIAGIVTTRSYVDTLNKRAVSTVSASGQVAEIRVIGDDVYLKTNMDLSGVGEEWMSLDPTRVPAGFALSFAPGKNDPGGSARLVDAVSTARIEGSQVAGTLDVTRMRVGNGINFRPGPGGTFPDAARNQPFRATLDAEGRLVSFVIPEANGAPAASLGYTDFGKAVEVVRPRGAVAAPAALYPQLGLGG
ncbi:hypothetical protein E1211_06105 [Micromonospora sp. 15K316]|uniref:hypothetical protein n=1 Tax=Micromonospora sp. 15K316 TaxID=2530376 RepID=UPI00104DDA96|nr:hypothetical protein [Micromonospora sp. 15K316]TDC38782.1 hypothetical protein E1211_06105 [Micromonospora sp. 15K316]